MVLWIVAINYPTRTPRRIDWQYDCHDQNQNLRYL
jgi:hypothetical protein